MDSINTALDSLVRSIKESEVFLRYQKAKEELHKEPELERKVHEFRKKNFQIQNSGNMNLFDEVDRLEQEGQEIRKNPLAGEFLDAELAFCRMYQNISWTLIEALDFEV